MIIGICAKKQCGKDSMAGFIKKQLTDMKVQQISFAKPLKDLACELFNIPKQNVYGSDADKNYPLCTWGEIFTGEALIHFKKKDRDLLSAREILQVFGTEVMRYGKMNFLERKLEQEARYFLQKKFGANAVPYDGIWIDLALMDIKVLKARGELDVAVVSDVRFPNEVNAIKDAGGRMVRLYRDTGSDDHTAHASELEMDSVPDDEFDFVLGEHQNKNLKQLERFTTRVLMECDLIGLAS